MKKKGRWDSSDEDEPRIDSKPISITTKRSKNIIDSKTEVITHQIKVAEIEKTQSSVSSFHETTEIQDRPSKVEKVRAKEYNPLLQGCRSVEEYERLNFISQGTYGVVFRAKCKRTDAIVAIKNVKLGSGESNRMGFSISALREINILISINHPNIVRVREMVIGSSIDKVYMVMDYCENDLKYCLDQSKHAFSTGEVKQLMVQLLSGIEHLHNNWLLHRDLKTSNILYSNRGVLTICDFGMARRYDSPIAPYTKEVVTLWYRPPELLLGAASYSTPLDMWSVACILAEILTRKPLFPGEGEVDQITRIFRMLGNPTEERWPGCSSLPFYSQMSWRHGNKPRYREVFPSASFSGEVALSDSGIDLLASLLHMDPKQRLSASSARSHPWLSSENPLPSPPERMPRFRPRHEHP